MRRWALLAALAVGGASADERVAICYDWGCAAEAQVVFSDAQLESVRGVLARAHTPAEERWTISRAVGMLYRWAGEQSPIATDRAGNQADAEAPGRMDCIDHSTSTTRLLRTLEAKGWLRFHRVLEPARRMRFIVTQHFAAVIEEKAPPLAVAAPRPVLPPAAVQRAPDYMAAMLYSCADCNDLLQDLRRPLRPPSPAGAARADGAAPPSANVGARFAVDSWFVDNGQPAVVLRFNDWMQGEGPDVD